MASTNDRQDGHAAPVAAAQAAPEATGPSLPRLLAEMPPTIDHADAEGSLRQYLGDPAHRAFALYERGVGTWRVSGQPSREQAEQRVLEGCQLVSGAPCVLFMIDDEVHTPAPGQNWAAADMPRLHPKPEFDANDIPILTPTQRQKPEITSYGQTPAAKAMALHPWGRAFTAISMLDQRGAEQKALDDCNADPDRHGLDGPCFLYAVGNKVVLAEGRTKPRTHPYEAIAAALALVSPTAANAASPYASDHNQKALAVHVGSGDTFQRPYVAVATGEIRLVPGG